MKKLFTALAAIAISASIVSAQAVERGTPVGEWRSWGADTHTTRYSPLDQIDASNFEDLEVAWMWRGDNYSPGGPDPLLRSTPIYVNGKLYSVAGSRRTVVSIDPATGETLWTFREPNTKRWEDSMRKNYGKGVAYDIVDGQERIYVITPGFFLWALDAETLPVHCHASLSHVSLPNSPSCGMTLNVHLWAPVFVSKPMMFPGTFSCMYS